MQMWAQGQTDYTQDWNILQRASSALMAFDTPIPNLF